MGIENGGPGPTGDISSDDELIEKNLAFINYLSVLGEGSDCDASFGEETIAPLKKPFVSRPEDMFRVERNLRKYEQEDSNERLKNRHNFSTAFEKSLIILGNLEGADFFGKNSEFAITSKFDDIVNGVDIAAKVTLEDDQKVFFGIDATTTQGEDHLNRKYYKNREKLMGIPEGREGNLSEDAVRSIRSGIRYWPKRLLHKDGVERERNNHKELPDLAINLIAGLPPRDAIDIIHLAVKAMAIEQKAKRGELKEGERENFIKTLKTSSARRELIDQMLNQTEKAIMSFDISSKERDTRLKLLRDHLIDADDLAEEEGASREESLSQGELSRFVGRAYTVPDSAYYEDTSKSSDD